MALPPPLSQTRSLSTGSGSGTRADVGAGLGFSDNIEGKLREMHARYTSLGEQLAAPNLSPAQIMALSKEFAELARVVELIEERTALSDSVSSLNAMERDLQGQECDEEEAEMLEMLEMLVAERAVAQASQAATEVSLLEALTPRDEADDRSVVLEVRAGTGGQEASLFASELFKMYSKYAQLRGWRWEELSVSKTDIGGFKEAQANVLGEEVFKALKFESGTHRVQRVPVNDSKLQTSAASVLVLPEVKEVEFELRTQDLRVDVFRSSGAGGQSVNTTESAVRITHLPTGLTVSMQDERSQIQNRARALTYLRARVADSERRKAAATQSELRKESSGTGDRSDKVRTYNFPQDRVTDHRVGVTVTGVERVLLGQDLDDLIDPLMEQDKKHRFEAFMESLATAGGFGDKKKK